VSAGASETSLREEREQAAGDSGGNGGACLPPQGSSRSSADTVGRLLRLLQALARCPSGNLRSAVVKHWKEGIDLG
jgi:glycine/D-amino acid oxidase-like deaminating enzyme